MSLFADHPPVRFGGSTVHERSQDGLPVARQRALRLLSLEMASKLKGSDDPETLVQRMQDSSCWFSPRNRAQAEHSMQGACLAYQMSLPYQIRHYTDMLVTVYTKDMAERTRALVRGMPGSTTFWHFEADYESGYPDTFTIPIASAPWGRQVQWDVCPLVDFPQRIPVHALQVWAILEQADIVPDGFWVADKVAVERPWISLDPILCCNFDRWFVGLVQWE